MPLVRGLPSSRRETVVPAYETVAVERPAFKVATEVTVTTTKEVVYFTPQLAAGRSCDSRMVLPGNWYVAPCSWSQSMGFSDFHMTKPMAPVPKTLNGGDTVTVISTS
jgi:hypothetical protein